MKIDIENTVTVKVALKVEDIEKLDSGEILHCMMETQADEKPMYISVFVRK